MNIDVDVKVQDLSKQLSKLSDLTEKERSRISEKVSSLDIEVNDKIKRLALNADQVTDIQRQVLESMDKRLGELEVYKDDGKD